MDKDPVELSRERLERVKHHVNAIQRLEGCTVIALVCAKNGHAYLIQHPQIMPSSVREVLGAFADGDWQEGEPGT